MPGARIGMVESNVFVTLPMMIRSTRESYQNVQEEEYCLNMPLYLLYVYHWTNGGTLANCEFRDLIPSRDRMESIIDPPGMCLQPSSSDSMLHYSMEMDARDA